MNDASYSGSVAALSAERSVVRPLHAAPADVADGELSDDELEHVVGGLARAWFEGVPSTPVMPDFPTGTTTAMAL